MSSKNIYPNYIDALIELLKTLNIKNKKIGYDIDDAMIEKKISESLNTTLIYNTELFYYPRLVKTDFEVQQLTKSARCNELSIYETVEKLYLGISEDEIVNIFNFNVAKNGGIPEIKMIKIGRNAVFGQCLPKKENKLQYGDILWFDSDARYQGYWSDIARIYIIGENNRASELYSCLREGMICAKQNIEISMSGKDVFNLTMDHINKNGFKDYRRHHIGHGIGLGAYKNPIISKNGFYIIEENSIISIETPYYEFGFGALHLEDPLLITKDQNIFLTQNSIPQDIILNL